VSTISGATPTARIAQGPRHDWPDLATIDARSVSAGDRWPSLPAEVEEAEPSPTSLMRDQARWARLEREQRSVD
jgi:hypothetical protein